MPKLQHRHFSLKNLLIGSSCFWLGLAAISLLQRFFFMKKDGHEMGLDAETIWYLADYTSLWTLTFVVFVIFGWSYQWQRIMRLLHLPIALIFGLVSLSLSMIFTMIVSRLMATEPSEHTFGEAFVQNVDSYLPFALRGALMYALVMLIFYGLDFYFRYKDELLQTSKLESQLAQAELQSLRMQLNPHFLFNALNTIAMMVRLNKNEQAVKMIAGMSDLLRQTLSADKTENLVLFSREIELLKQYLDIEQHRFSDKLSIQMDIDPRSRSVLFPSLLLQPILENVFKHGISENLDNTIIKINSFILNEQLKIKIINSGPSLPADWSLEKSQGIGLKNTQARLQQLYGENCKFEVRNIENSGVEVCIEIPYKVGD